MDSDRDLEHRSSGAAFQAGTILAVVLTLVALACSVQRAPDETVVARTNGAPAPAEYGAPAPEADARKRLDRDVRPQAAVPAPGATGLPAGARAEFMQLGYGGSETVGSTEQYDFVEETGFVEVSRQPLSTFSIDVDTASYANVRRILLSGNPPPAGAVRIEEMLNYFSYDYPDANGDEPFGVTVENTTAPWAEQHQLVRIALQGRHIDQRDLPPRNLTFLIDVSGSMQSPNKLELVKYGLSGLTRMLRPEDRVAIVVYAGASGLVLPPTSGDDRGRILAALGQLQAGGSTAGAAGIRLAYEVARRSFDPEGINRVVLATDGDFNVGVSNRSDLVELIERERESGVFLTVLGVGRGNLKDATMEQLANHGNGNYAYLDSRAEARKVLGTEAGGTLVTIAKDVKIQVEWNPAHVSAYRLIGYENRMLAARDFNDDTKDAGEIGAGHSVTALYEVVPAGVAPPTGDVDRLRYQSPRRSAGPEYPDEMLTLKLRYKEPDGDLSLLISRAVPAEITPLDDASDDLRFAAAVAAFGMLLRGSEHAGTASWSQVESLARSGLGVDAGGQRAEFLTLLGVARQIDPAAADLARNRR